jgi:hypothetical protein
MIDPKGGPINMPATPAELFHDWHDFYVLVATASATLVGLMFVATSIGTTIFNEDHRAALETFLTPTVVHFAAVLFSGLVIVIPVESWTSLGAVLGAGGLAGAVYCGRLLVLVFVRHSFKVERIDRVFYLLIPFVGYLLVLASAVLLFMASHDGADVMAVAILVLLIAGLRNAWDMMLWIVLRTPGGTPPPQG